jgi:hypothetical protein
MLPTKCFKRGNRQVVTLFAHHADSRFILAQRNDLSGQNPKYFQDIIKNCYHDRADNEFFPEALRGFRHNDFGAGSSVNVS